MFVKSKLLDFFLRAVVGLAIGLALGLLMSEFSFRFLDNKETAQREPQQIEIVVPYGTAKQVEEGFSNPSIPTNLVFVEGDVLVIKNEDVVAHQIGPMWVPPGTSSALSLDQANNYTYSCSFRPTKNIGLDVLPRVTSNTRTQAILAIGLPSGMMLAVYSYLVPVKNRKNRLTSAG